jgi:hypothetical protein
MPAWNARQADISRVVSSARVPNDRQSTEAGALLGCLRKYGYAGVGGGETFELTSISGASSMPSDNTLEPPDPPTAEVHWDIRREGRAWIGDEGLARFQLTPEKFEMWQGKLFFSEAERMTMLGLLLENVGADRAVRLGNPEVWRSAVRTL